jgi:VWFA-related protein
VAAVLVAVTVSVSGQQPLFRARVDYVELDVVVTDRNNTPVRTLTRDDFRIQDAGRPQAIDAVRLVDIPTAVRALPPAASALPTLDVVANTRSNFGRHWVVVIDDLHLFEQYLVETRRAVERFLELVAADDHVAVVFVGRSDLSLDFTQDAGRLAQVPGRLRDALGFALDPVYSFGADDRLIKCAVRLQFARSTLDVVENVIASLLHSTVERRVLVYVSHGFDYERGFMARPSQPTPGLPPSGIPPCPHEEAQSGHVFDQLGDLFVRARRAGVPVYTIDPRGVTSPLDDGGRRERSPRALRSQLDFLREVADQTGGRALVNRPDLASAIAEVVAENSTFYVLGYYPKPFVRDGRFHEVTVSVPGHPQYRVKAKAGYTTPPAVRAERDVAQLLDEAAGAALPIADLGMSLFAAPLAPGTDGRVRTAVTFELTYPPSPAPLTDDVLDVRLVAIDHEGKPRASASRRFQFRGSAPPGAAARFLVNDAIELPAEPLILRVAAASRTLGRLGSTHLPIVVPKLVSNSLHLTPPVFGMGGAVREPALNGQAIAGLVPFQPTTTRTFAATDAVRVFVRAFVPESAPAVTATLTVRGTSVERVQRETLAVQSSPRSVREASWELALPLAGLPTGAYVVQVVATDPAGRTDRREVSFMIK